MEIKHFYFQEERCPSSAIARVPQVEDLAAKPLTVNAPLHLVDFQLPQRHTLHHQAKYLKSVASDLTFSKDVVEQRGLQSLPFYEWNTRNIYDASNILPDIKKRSTVKRPLKLDPQKHKLCQMKNASPRIQKAHVRASPPLGESLFKPIVGKGQIAGIVAFPSSISIPDEAVPPRTFETELPETDPTSSQIDKSASESSDNLITKMQGGWEEGVLKQLTKNTAQWIVSQQISNAYVRDQVCLRYGLCRSQDLISEECFVQTDFLTIEELEEADRKHIPCLAREEPDIPLAVYYRVPSYCPPKTIDDELGSQNLTTDIVPVVHFEPPPPLKLQDMMNPRAGKYRYFTENSFEHELYSGSARIVHQRSENKGDRILMDSLNEYNKNLQQAFPRSHEHWSFAETGKVQKPKRRALRWKALPTAVDTQVEMRPLRGVAKVKPEVLTKKDSLTHDQQLLKNMLDGWKEAWLLSVRWHDVTLAQLKKGLSSLHDDDKVMAIAICASAALERPKQQGPLRDLGICTYKKSSTSPDVPEDLMIMITEALKNQNGRVRMAAAIFHFVVQVQNEEARQILQHALEHGNDADSWAAAQCLAIDGDNTFPVLERLLTQLLEVEGIESEDQVCMLLTQLSEGTTLVQSLLADRLNSSSWRERNVACRALSRLNSHTSQDLRNKLVQIMWEDWSAAVRRAAAQALGRMGLGILVHNQLREKLEEGDSRTRVEALCVIGWLRLMTSKLMPGFLQCFSDEFVTVRREACHAAGALQLKDPMVLQCLIKLIQSDPIWKIKAFAIKAVRQIGQSSAEVRELLLWAVHYEEEPGVRLQACRTIAALQLRDPDVQSVLQDRLLLDSSELVKREAIRALRALDISPDASQNTMQMIKNKLHQLCQKDVVVYKIMKLDKIMSRDRHRAQKLSQGSYGEEPKNKPCHLAKTLSEGSRPITQMTLVSEEELKALIDHSSSPTSERTLISQEAGSEEESPRDGEKKETTRGSSKPLWIQYRLGSVPEDQTAS